MIVSGPSDGRFLALIWLASLAGATLAQVPPPNHPNPPRPAIAGAENIVFPANSGIVDVTAAPYGAKGDGATDDTRAIQAALDDYPNAGAIIYLPNGTYLISDTIRWPHGQHGGAEEKNTILQGQSRVGVVLKLKAHCPGFADPNRPKEMVWTGGSPAQRFRNSIRNCTWYIGTGNPGAIGVRFDASNCGSLRDVDIRAEDGGGVTGLDQAYADDFGPCFVKNVTVEGFDVGIASAHSVNGVVYCNITLRHQRRCGWLNEGAPISVENLVSDNSVPAILNGESGLVTLVGATLNGKAPAESIAAVQSRGGAMFAKDLSVSGYASAIEQQTRSGKQVVPGPRVKQWASATLPESAESSLDLPIKPTPDVPWDDLKDWAVVTDYGAKMDGQTNDSDALQRAIDSGRTTVCMPRGVLVLKKPITLRGRVRRLIGCETELRFPSKMTGSANVFTVGESSEPVIVVERFACWFWSNNSELNFIDNPTRRTLVLRDLNDLDDTSNAHPNGRGTVISGPGDLFVEDVAGRFDLKPAVHAWMRYVNPETNQGGRNTTIPAQWHIKNEGGTAWIFGIKTEGPGPVIIGTEHSSTELLGGLMYSSGGTRTQDQPAFIFEDSRASVSILEVNFSNNSYPTWVLDRRIDKTAVELKPDPATGGAIPFWATPDRVP